MRPSRPLLVLKVGSTSLSVLVTRRLADPLFSETQILRLFAAPRPACALEQALEALEPRVRRFHPELALAGLGEVGRGHPELAEVLKRRGYPVWALTGPEEAQAGWWGEQAFSRERIRVVDVGGGSTEVADGRAAASLPVGAERPPQGPLPWPDGCPLPVVGLGGSARALAHLLGNPLARSRLESLSATPTAAWPARPADIDPARWRLLPGGAATWAAVLRASKMERVQVSDRDLRWGLYLAARLGRAGRWMSG